MTLFLFVQDIWNNRQIFHGQVERTNLSRKILYHFVSVPKKILILKNSRILLRSVYGTPTDRLARGPWGAGIAWQAHRRSYGSDRCAARGACQLQLSTLARQAIGRRIHIAIVGRASAHIRLSLRINISLIIGEIYKMVEDFSIQFSPFYLPMKYLAIIFRHCIPFTLYTIHVPIDFYWEKIQNRSQS